MSNRPIPIPNGSSSFKDPQPPIPPKPKHVASSSRSEPLPELPSRDKLLESGFSSLRSKIFKKPAEAVGTLSELRNSIYTSRRLPSPPRLSEEAPKRPESANKEPLNNIDKPQKVSDLENEIKEKDKKIEDLIKQLKDANNSISVLSKTKENVQPSPEKDNTITLTNESPTVSKTKAKKKGLNYFLKQEVITPDVESRKIDSLQKLETRLERALKLVRTRKEKLINDEKIALNERRLCVICQENVLEILFAPCGHVCTCKECSELVKDCPICRNHIDNKVVAYLS